MAQAVVVTKRKVRYAVVGIGWISQTAFLPGVEHTGNSEVVAFVTGHEDKAAKVGEKYGVNALYSYDEYDDLLRSGTVDAVYLATPNFDHVDLAIRTLDAGLHLLLEKPMATSVEDCQRIIDASVRSGARLMVAYRLHHEPGALKAFEVARSGSLGHLRYFNSSFSQPVNFQNHRAKHGFWAGPVPDMGPYPINTARNLFAAEPIQVYAMGTRTEPERFRDFDDQVAVSLRFPGDRLATMLLSYSAADLDDFRIVGTLGDLYSSPAFSMGTGMKHEINIGKSRSTESFPQTDQFGGELKYFSGCILDGKDPEASGEEGLLDIRVIAAVERSLLSGHPEPLEPYVRHRRPTFEQVQHLPKTSEPDLVGVHPPSQGR
ncbi:MAG TPA: Gfo/Idh/MocA family oxidoreductase [Acidobacteriaceae bacterium]|jgi:predicted dehydrogenase|nr:Gfo/Idh/MocA family oxidoreductase [Acidobacteriaceae bacterium]